MDLPQLVYIHCTMHKRQCILLSVLFLSLEKKDEGISIDLHIKLWFVKTDRKVILCLAVLIDTLVLPLQQGKYFANNIIII